MKELYVQLWQQAKSFYKKGRPMDIAHIEWMMDEAIDVCDQEKLDDTVLLPLVILHDVGYAKVDANNPFNLDIRKQHMIEGEKITRQLLENVQYPQEKITVISYYVSVHDNWALGDTGIYKNNHLLGTFTDLDFTWMASPKGFRALMNILHKNYQEMLNYLQDRDQPAKGVPFTSPIVEKLFWTLLQDREKELQP